MLCGIAGRQGSGTRVAQVLRIITRPETAG